MPTEKYKCASCGEEFDSEWSEEEAVEELEDNFPGVSREECAVVCHNCYNLLMGRIHAN